MLKQDLEILKDIAKGIGDSPSTGFEDIRNLNINHVTGSVTLNLGTTALSLPPTVSALAYTCATNDVFTVASSSGWFNGMAIVLNTVVTAVGISTGRVYWVGNLTSTTFKLYKNPNLLSGNLVDITTGGSGTLTSYVLGKPIDRAVYDTEQYQNAFILDDQGQTWGVNNFSGSLSSNLVFLGNDNAASGNGKAIAVLNGNLLVFSSTQWDRIPVNVLYADSTDIDGVGGWVYNVTSVSSINKVRRPVFSARNDVVYFDDDDGQLGSINTSWSRTSIALDLPNGEDIVSLGELGQYLLVGGRTNHMYPWNKNTQSFEAPIKIPSRNIQRIVGIAQIAYVFAGNKGEIYATNGVSVALFKKIPETVTAQVDPLISWDDATAHNGQLYCSFSTTKNDGTALTTVGGVWAIDLNTKALRLEHQLSYGSYTGTTTLLMPNLVASYSIGDELIIAWADGLTYGVDYGSTSYHGSYSAYLISGEYLVGTALEKTALNQLEITLDNPLASGEGVRISYRPDRNTAFTGTTTFDYSTYGARNSINLDFPAIDLVSCQIKIEVTGSTTTPSLRDVRLR